MEKTKQHPLTQTVHELVTNQVIVQLEKGIVPWKQSWGQKGVPTNFFSQKAFRGTNLFLLTGLDYPSNYFLSFEQVKELGGSVRKGEKSCIVVYWKLKEELDDTSKEKVKRPHLLYYRVFNIAQCDKLPQAKLPDAFPENDPTDNCEKLMYEMHNCPPLRHSNGAPFYNSMEDFINMPSEEDFDCVESYYDALLFQLMSSTGHQSRLNRKEVASIDYPSSEPFGIEELICELGTCILKSLVGLPEDVSTSSKDYLAGWIDKLNQDAKYFVYACSQAQKAVDYITGYVPEAVAEQVTEAHHE